MYPNWILYVLLASLILLSLINYKKAIITSYIRNTILRPISLSNFEKREREPFGSINLILFINFVITSGLASYMLGIYYGYPYLSLTLLPGAYYFFLLTSLGFVGRISGERKRILENTLNTVLILHTWGILLIPFILIWILNPAYSSIMAYIILGGFSLISILRILKGISIALKNKLLWYYIILYLCTFEIWPFVAVYVLESPYFIK